MLPFALVYRHTYMLLIIARFFLDGLYIWIIRHPVLITTHIWMWLLFDHLWQMLVIIFCHFLSRKTNVCSTFDIIGIKFNDYANVLSICPLGFGFRICWNYRIYPEPSRNVHKHPYDINILLILRQMNIWSKNDYNNEWIKGWEDKK
jgi:hypothetical protein